MCGKRARNFFRHTHCPRNAPDLTCSSVRNRGSKRKAAPCNFEFVILPDQRLCAGGESRQTAIVAALLNRKALSFGSSEKPVVNTKRSLRKISKASRFHPKSSFVEVSKHASGYWSVSSSSQSNDGGDGPGLSYSWHAGINTRINGLRRLKESTSATSTVVNKLPPMMAESQANHSKRATTMVSNCCNHYHHLRTILLILEDKSIKFKSISEPHEAEISSVLSSLVVTYEMEKPNHLACVRNVAQTTPFYHVVEEMGVHQPPDAYEFAKVHGYDFVRLKACRPKSRRRRKRHQRNKSHRIMYKKGSKSFTDKSKFNACYQKYYLQTTKCKTQQCEDPKMPYSDSRPHILNSVTKDAELLDLTRNDIESLGKVSTKPRKLEVDECNGNNCEAIEGNEDGAEVRDRLNERIEAVVSTASHKDSMGDLSKAYIQISQERRDLNASCKTENRDRKDSEKVSCSAVECLGSIQSERTTVMSVLPRLSAKTSKQYQLYNSLSAAIFREKQLAKKKHEDELKIRNSSAEQLSGVSGESHVESDRVKHTILNQTPYSSLYYFNRHIDDVRLEEASPFTNHISTSSPRYPSCLETDVAVCIEKPCTINQSLVSDNCNNNALPELQLSLDDLRNDFSFSEDEGDKSWEPRRPRESSRSSCQLNEDTYPSSKQNTANKGLLRLPLLLNNSSRRLSTSKKPAESASPIPPIASLKSVENKSAKKNVKQSRIVKKMVDSTSYHFDLFKERLPGDMKSVRSKRRPTRLSPVVLKQTSNFIHNINAQGDPQNEELNLENAEKKVSSNIVFSTPIQTSELPSSCLVEDKRNALGLPHSTCQHAFGDSAVSPRVVKSTKNTFLRSPDFACFGSKPEHIVASTLAKETRFLPNLKHSENLLSNINSDPGGNSNSSPPPIINNSHSLNINNSSTRSRSFCSQIKKKGRASPITSGQKKGNHNCNAIPVQSSGKTSRKRVDLSCKLCQYQDKFIGDLDSELQTLIESQPKHRRSQASDVNTSNTTRRLGHYREPAFENSGRAIRYGNMRQTKPTRHVPFGGFFEAATPFNLSEGNADRGYRLWSTNSEKPYFVQNQSEVPGSGETQVENNSEGEISHQPTYTPYGHFPTTEAPDRQANYFDRHLTIEENSSDCNNAVSKYNSNDPNSQAFTGYFQQGGDEEAMEVEDTATEGSRYEMNLLAMCRKLDERLQLSQGALPQALESMLLSFGRKLESLLKLVNMNIAHTAINNSQEENECCSQLSNNESVSRQSEPDIGVSVDSRRSSVNETKSNSVRGILKTIETTNKTMPSAATRKKVVIQSESSLKCASIGSLSSSRSGSRKNKRRFRSTSSSQSSKTSSKKHRRPRRSNQLYKGAHHWKEEIYTPLNTHLSSKGKRADTRYHSYQHSRACRRRHATEGTCCNVCFQRAYAALNKPQSSHARRKSYRRGIEKKATGAKRKTAGFAKAYGRKSRAVRPKRRNTRRTKVVRKTYRSRNRTSNNSNGCRGGVHQRATVNQNRNQNSRPKKSKKKSTGGKVTKSRKITRRKVSYVITPKGKKNMYAILQKRYQYLLQYVQDLNSSAKVSTDSKHTDEYVQNLAARFRHLVTNFPKHKLKTLENIFNRYQDVSDRYQDKKHNISSSSSSSLLDCDQISKAENSAPRSLKRKKPMEEPHASNASENIYSKTQRNKSHNSKNRAGVLPEKSTYKKARPAKAVDSLILARRRLVERRNKSRNACLQPVNMASNTRVFQGHAHKQRSDFSLKSVSYTSAERSVSNSGVISSCSSCENMINACIFQPTYILEGYSSCTAHPDTFNFGTTLREAQPENLLMQKSNAFCTSQWLFGNNLLSNVQNPKFTTKLPTNTPLKDGQDQSLCNYFLLTNSNQQSTSKMILPNNLFHNDLQQQSNQGMFANTPFKQHCTDQAKAGKVFGQFCSNRMPQGVSSQSQIFQNNVVSMNDEDSIKSTKQGFFPKTLFKNSNELCPNKSKQRIVANVPDSLGVLDNTGKENEAVREQFVNPARELFKFSSPLWCGLEPQFERSLFKKSILCDSNDKLDVSLPENNTEYRCENNNIDSDLPSNISRLQNHSSILHQASVTASPQNSPRFIIRHVDEQHTQVGYRENSPSSSSVTLSNSQDRTNNSMECNLDSNITKKDIQKSNGSQIEPFWEKVQPYFIAHSPGISTTWKCYYDSPRNIRVATKKATQVSNTLSVNRILDGTTTQKQTSECAPQHLSAKETNASTECSPNDEDITKRPRPEHLEGTSSIEQPTSTERAPGTSIGENANDNARNIVMSWSANTVQEFGNLVGETKSLRIDDFRNTSSTFANPWVAHGNCVGSMVFFPGTACLCHVDPCFPCAHVKAVDTRETNGKYPILRNGAFAQKHFAGTASSKMVVHRYFSPLWPTESVSNYSNKSTLCSHKGTSLDTFSNCREVVLLQEADISSKSDISIRKRHAKSPLSDFLVPPRKIPKLEIQSCSDQMIYRHRVSKRLRRSRFQLIRELRYLNKWQEAMEKLRRYEESNRMHSLITIDRSTQYDLSSDADSESSL